MFKENILKDKVALITGGRTGMGLSMTNAYLNYGAKVVVIGRSGKDLEETFKDNSFLNKTLILFACDIRENDQIKKAVNFTIQKFGQIDILINNASVSFAMPAEKILPNTFELSINTNMIGYFNFSREIGKQMIKQGQGGKIINISAYHGSKAYPGFSHMHMARSAVNAMTTTLADEWGRFGIRVNAICPGPVLTDNVQKAYMKVMKERSLEEVTRHFIDHETPMKEYIDEESIANMAVYLASPMGNQISGTIIDVDGGYLKHNQYYLENFLGVS